MNGYNNATHNGCALYKSGYKVKIRCDKCNTLFVSKKKIIYPILINDLKEVKNIKWYRYYETEMNFPWYYVKEKCAGEDGFDDFVCNCVGEKVLGNECYYPVCNLNESMMKKLTEMVNVKCEDKT